VADATRTAVAERRAPTVICDDVHVVYRVLGGKKRPDATATRGRRSLRRPGAEARKVHAVRGVSLVAHEGDAIALIGRNGSGKSTLLRAISGLMPPESGHVYTAGRPTLLGVNAALIKDLPGEDNILLGCMAMGMTRQEARAQRDWIVEFADLGDFISLPMRTYSSGMAARLRFAIAAAKSHEILMIDEALATGDAEFRRRSEQRIVELRKQAGTVFLVSHSLGVVRMTCNRALWLEQGRVIMDGEVNEVVDAYEDMYDPEQEALERKQLRAKRRRQRDGSSPKRKRARSAAAIPDGTEPQDPPAALPTEAAPDAAGPVAEPTASQSGTPDPAGPTSRPSPERPADTGQ
jgi:teichoic acid transport system ATP-binding protein